MEKRTLNLSEIEAQTALELPDRDMMLVTIVITNLLNNLTIDIDVTNNRVAVLICAFVDLLDQELFEVNTLECDIQQAGE